MTTQTTGFQTTYGQLKAHAANVQTTRGFSKQQVMNFASAINGWMRRLNLQDSDLVGDELGQRFNEHFQKHADYLDGRVSTRTARDQAENLLTWRRFAEECKRVDMLPAAPCAH
ncbi:hypothetical protein [Noviherbaspirillum autotrophicum]|uniref:hypothetical protein n=1 Tax=Noviherbaspirillum autotrophicum TaxID=709839 RepID=UPI0012FDDD15|nr:hypothetical protein [Noviherbaspirillum autotrophicum]